MANTTITNVQSLFAGNAVNVSKGQDVQNTESFSKVFDKTQNPMENQTSQKDIRKADTTDDIRNHARIQQKRSSENLKEQAEEPTDKTDLETAMENAAGMMMTSIAEILDVSVEEVQSVMDELGLTSLDLLNGENLTQIVMALNPGADAFTIMTDEELFGDFKELMNTAEELTGQLSEQFGMSTEEILAAADALKSQMDNNLLEEIPTDTVEAPTEIPVEVITEEMDMRDRKENYEPADAANSTPDTTELIRTTESVETTPVPTSRDSSETKEHSEGETKDSSFQNTGYHEQVMNQLADAVENTSSATTSYGVSGQDIIRQMTDYIKLHVNADTTEMELQLHPASLGNIKVQIASTGGVLTATFTTENEAVKSALEGQLIQLKESFEQQGLRVENIEVNVSAQGFERSLDQQQQGQNAFEDRTGESRSRNRRIRLHGLEETEDGMSEELSEGDKVVADMMLRNGNSIDYTV